MNLFPASKTLQKTTDPEELSAAENRIKEITSELEEINNKLKKYENDFYAYFGVDNSEEYYVLNSNAALYSISVNGSPEYIDFGECKAEEEPKPQEEEPKPNEEKPEPKPPVEGNVIAGNPKDKAETRKYRSTVTYYANVPEGGKVQWYLNGNKVEGTVENGVSSYTVKEAKDTYTIKAETTDADGNITYDSEKVEIQNSFFNKIISFFVLLFKKDAYTYYQK